MRKLTEALVYSNLYAVVLIVAFCIQSAALFQSGEVWLSEKVLLVVSATLFLYPFHRIFGIKSIPPEAMMERHYFAEKNAIIIWLLSAVGFFSAAVCLVNLNWLQLLPHVPFGLIALGYVLPIYKKKNRWAKLREIPYLKAGFIGLVVSYLTVVFPFYGIVDDMLVLGLFLARFFFVVAITIPFDIRDYGVDKQLNLKTLPIVFGIEKAKKIALFSNLLFSAVVFVWFYFSSDISVFVFLALWLSEIYANYWIRKSTPTKSELWYAGAIEGSIIIQTLLVLLFWFLA